MNRTIRKWKWFWAWQDEQEESWLHSMSKQGLHLIGAGFAGFYEFEQGTPRNYFYRLDFMPSQKDMEHYHQIFIDAGWEHIGSLSGWKYFRKEAQPGETPEIFTDPQSKVEKYRRIMLFLIILNPVIFFVIIITRDNIKNWFFGCIFVFYLVLLVLFMTALIKLSQRIKELKAL
jgi:hypothetical protein